MIEVVEGDSEDERGSLVGPSTPPYEPPTSWLTPHNLMGSFSWNYGWEPIQGELPEDRAERVYWYLYNYQLDDRIAMSNIKIAFLCATTPEDAEKLKTFFDADPKSHTNDLKITGTDNGARFINRLLALLCRDLRDKHRSKKAKRICLLPLSTRMALPQDMDVLAKTLQPVLKKDLKYIERKIQNGWQVHQVFSMKRRPSHIPESLHELLTTSLAALTERYPPTPAYQQAIDDPYPSHEGIIRLFRRLGAAEHSPLLWREAKMILLHYIAQLPPERRWAAVQAYEPFINRHQHSLSEMLGRKTRTRKLVEQILKKTPVLPQQGSFSLSYVLLPLPGESAEEQAQRVFEYLTIVLMQNEHKKFGLLFPTYWQQSKILQKVYAPHSVFSNTCPKILGTCRSSRFYAALAERLNTMLSSSEALDENCIAKRIHLIPLSATTDNAPLWWGNEVTQAMLDTELSLLETYVKEAGYDVYVCPSEEGHYRYANGFTSQRHGRVAKIEGIACSGADYLEERLAALERTYPRLLQPCRLAAWYTVEQLEAFMTKASEALRAFGKVDLEFFWSGRSAVLGGRRSYQLRILLERGSVYQSRDVLLSDWNVYKKMIIHLITQACPTQRHHLINTYSNIIDMRRTPIFFKDFLISLFGEPLPAFFQTRTRRQVDAIVAQTEMLLEQAPKTLSAGASI